MQCKKIQHAMKKLHKYLYRNKIYEGLFFVVKGLLAKKCSKSTVFINSES